MTVKKKVKTRIARISREDHSKIETRRRSQIRLELKKRARENGFNQPIRVRVRQNETSPQEKVFMVVARRV